MELSGGPYGLVMYGLRLDAIMDRIGVRPEEVQVEQHIRLTVFVYSVPWCVLLC